MELCWITAAGVRTLTPDEARECAVRDDGVLWAHCDHQDIAGMALLTELVPVRRPDHRTRTQCDSAGPGARGSATEQPLRRAPRPADHLDERRPDPRVVLAPQRPGRSRSGTAPDRPEGVTGAAPGLWPSTEHHR